MNNPDTGGEATSTAGTEAPSGKTFAEQLTGPGAATKPGGHQPTAATRQVQATNALRVNDVAADLKAGKLTPQGAIDKVLERVVARQLGTDAPAAVRERVRVALQDAIESDPLLAEKLSRIG